MPREIIILQRGRGEVLLSDGYQYHRKKIYKNAEYWCVKTKSTKCVGSVTIKERTILKEVAHSSWCLKDVAKNEIDIRLSNCKKEIAASPEIPVPTIFENIVAGIEDDGLDLVGNIPQFQNIKSAMYNHRNKVAGTRKMFFNNLQELEVPPAYHKFLIADYHHNGVRIIIFGGEWAKDLLTERKVFFLDGTFKICPKPFTQLVTMHCDLGSSMESTLIIPTIYALLPDKKTETYKIMFKLLKSAIPAWNPAQIMADFEPAITKAMEDVLPGIKKDGCYYHFTKAIWKMGKELKLTKNKEMRRIISLSAALPLLPFHKIKGGWSYIESQMRRELKMEDFQHYFKTFWLKNDNFIAQWCVFRYRHRTNNYAEAWHFKINDKNNRKISLYALLKKLYKNSVVNRNTYLAITVQKKAPKKRGMKYILRDQFIENAQNQLVAGNITVGHFLDMLR
ncbi:uncharacterized protein LOC133528658 [Cydia pomonella]|uniref:uncharacterized protein LOC133528658 n=1 Tax=Cydia pomonella TaxID=82600 RepID=UPI002ADD3640|nr:uncharacterized protein LOC133528658 [Cydia pomonella]